MATMSGDICGTAPLRPSPYDGRTRPPSTRSSSASEDIHWRIRLQQQIDNNNNNGYF